MLSMLIVLSIASRVSILSRVEFEHLRIAIMLSRWSVESLVGLAKTLKQIAKFRLLPTSITEIDVEKNPINDLMLLRAFVAHRLPHINSINGVTIADSERYRASRIFSKASHITQKTKENGLFANINQERYKQVSENYTTSIVNHAVRIEERLTQLNETWPEIVNKIVKDTMIGLDSVAMFSSMSFNK